MRYEGNNQYVKCPECGHKHELFVNGFEDREMTTIRCGFTGDMNRVRSPNDGCGELIGLQLYLTAKFTVFKMSKVT
jgi:hypothetical protein